jgi:hypothetical protein
MDNPAEREDETRVDAKRKDVNATRSLKRSRKEHESDGLETERVEIEDSQDPTGGPQATEEIVQKPRKKKSKKLHAAHEVDDRGDTDMMATQSSMMLKQTPQSTLDTANGDTTKRVKAKRKRPTGRPSGLNILPAGMSNPITQEDSAMTGMEPSAVAEPPRQPVSPTQAKPKKSKGSKHVSEHLSPVPTNAQSSQVQVQNNKPSKVKETLGNGTSSTNTNSLKASKKRKAEVQKDTDMPPLPEASQAPKLKAGKSSKEAVHAEEADDGALRADYEVVDATKQVEGWLSSQLNARNSPATPRSDPPITLRRKAAVNASAKREKAQRSEGQETSKKRLQNSQRFENDNEDHILDEELNPVVAETPRSSGRRRKTQPSDEIEEIADDAAAQDFASPLVSKKARRSSQKAENPAGRITSHNGKSAPMPSTPVAESSTKWKRNCKPTNDDDEIDKLSRQPTNDGTSDDQIVAAMRRPAHNADRSLKGPLTLVEKDKVETVFKDIIDKTGTSDADLRSMIQKWRTATEFKEAVESALPNRPLAAIRKYCQRRYHNMERGPWSADDDESLRNAHAAHPDKWTEISALVGRTASDCKDRWKNVVSIQDTMQIGPWSQEETVALVNAVDNTVKELKKANKDNKRLSRAELESMLSWPEVAKKLDGTRSAKRCNEKWQKLKRGEDSGRASISAQPLSTGLDPAKSSKKLRLIEKKYNQCDVGDLYDILTEIHTALPDPTQHFDLESTLWSVVSLNNPGSRFNSAMRRRGLHDAAEVYPEEVGKDQTVSEKAKALAKFLEKQWGIKELAKKRSFFPKSKAGKFKSTEKVESDEEEEEEVEDYEDEKVGLETDTLPTSNSDDEDDDNNDKVNDDDKIDDQDEDCSEQSSEVEVPDSQPQPAADNKDTEDDFAFTFKPINRKGKEPSPPQVDVDSDVVEKLPSSVQRKKSSQKAKMKVGV